MIMVGRVSSVPPSLPAEMVNAALFGMSFGEYSARRVNLHRYRAMFPARWSGFLKENFPNNTQAAAFFDVDEGTIRNWKGGKTAPRGEFVALACTDYPALLPYLMGLAA